MLTVKNIRADIKMGREELNKREHNFERIFECQWVNYEFNEELGKMVVCGYKGDGISEYACEGVVYVMNENGQTIGKYYLDDKNVG